MFLIDFFSNLKESMYKSVDYDHSKTHIYSNTWFWKSMLWSTLRILLGYTIYVTIMSSPLLPVLLGIS